MIAKNKHTCTFSHLDGRGGLDGGNSQLNAAAKLLHGAVDGLLIGLETAAKRLDLRQLTL
jgi:hypothetical protein